MRSTLASKRSRSDSQPVPSHKRPARNIDQERDDHSDGPPVSMFSRFGDMQLHHHHRYGSSHQALAVTEAGNSLAGLGRKPDNDDDQGENIGRRPEPNNISALQPCKHTETTHLAKDAPSDDTILLEPPSFTFHPSKGSGRSQQPARVLSNTYQSFTTLSEPMTAEFPSTAQISSTGADHAPLIQTNDEADDARPEKPAETPPPTSDLTWANHEITGHLLSASDILAGDDGTGINGVGFRPTAGQAAVRVQKRRRQVEEWRRREEREERERRRDGRRVEVRHGTARRRGTGGSGGRLRRVSSGSVSGNGSTGEAVDVVMQDDDQPVERKKKGVTFATQVAEAAE